MEYSAILPCNEYVDFHKLQSYIGNYGIFQHVCFSDCVSYALCKLQMTNITLKAEQRYSMEAIFELCIVNLNLITRMCETVCTRPSLQRPGYEATTCTCRYSTWERRYHNCG